jgi:hypothetical protein
LEIRKVNGDLGVKQLTCHSEVVIDALFPAGAHTGRSEVVIDALFSAGVHTDRFVTSVSSPIASYDSTLSRTEVPGSMLLRRKTIHTAKLAVCYMSV